MLKLGKPKLSLCQMSWLDGWGAKCTKRCVDPESTMSLQQPFEWLFSDTALTSRLACEPICYLVALASNWSTLLALAAAFSWELATYPCRARQFEPSPEVMMWRTKLTARMNPKRRQKVHLPGVHMAVANQPAECHWRNERLEGDRRDQRVSANQWAILPFGNKTNDPNDRPMTIPKGRIDAMQPKKCKW